MEDDSHLLGERDDDPFVGSNFAIPSRSMPPLKTENSWLHSAGILVTDLVGTGIMALAGVFAKTGWVSGIIFMCLAYVINLYTGLMLARLKDAYSSCNSYAELATALFPDKPWVSICGALVVYVSLTLILTQYQILMARAVQAILLSHALCRPQAGLLVGFVILVPAQMRRLRGIAYASILSLLMILVVILICFTVMIKEGVNPANDDNTSDSLTRDSEGTEASVFFLLGQFAAAFSATSFAMAGQKIYMEIMAQMHTPSDFSQSLYLATPLMVVLYGVVGMGGSALQGSNTPAYFLDVIPQGTTTKAIASTCMLIHVIISFLLTFQIVVRAIHVYWDPILANTYDHTSFHDRDTGSISKLNMARSQWALVSVSMFMCTWFLSNLIPFFSDMVELSGSILTPLSCHIFPALMLLGAGGCIGGGEGGIAISKYEQYGIWLLLIAVVFIAVLSTMGTYMAIKTDMDIHGAPFSCFCESASCPSA